MSWKRYLVNHLTSILPPMRFFRLKNRLWALSGVDIDMSARVVSSANFWGKGKVSIGERAFIGHDTLLLTGDSEIRIAKDVDIGPRVTIVNGTHHIDMVGLRSAGDGCSNDIVVEKGVWIGAGSTVMSGVSIGEKSVIGAGSVVTENIPSHVIAVGVPCKPIKKWDPLGNKWVKLMTV